MSSLHTPITIGSSVIRNRLYRAPVLEGAGGRPDGPDIYRHAFEENARAGVGLIIQGNSCITDEGRSSPGMSQVDTRARTLALADVTRAVHAHGGRIFLQIGHAGIYAMEGWHATYAATRKGPIIAVSKPPVHVRPALRGVPIHVLTTPEIYELAEAFGRTAAWAREAGYDGIQIASSNAKLIHQFLSPYYNRRTDEFGASLQGRARILELLANTIRSHVGNDYPLTVKIPIGEDAPPFAPRTTFDEGIELCRLAESFGYHAITPVGLSVFPHGSLCRGGYPSSIDDTESIKRRYEEALEAVPVRTGVEPAVLLRSKEGRVDPRVRRRRHPHARRSSADPRSRRGRHDRGRPALLRRVRPSDEDPRRRHRAAALRVVEPLSSAPDARHESRVLQPERRAQTRGDARGQRADLRSGRPHIRGASRWNDDLTRRRWKVLRDFD